MNPKLKVHTLNVKSFRGISQEISLQLGDITIIKGENGTGKSSFVNAIEYLFSNDLAFLKNKTINTNRAAFNYLADKDDAKIELRFTRKKYVKFEHSHRENSPVFDEILKNNYIKSASFILNRKKLLQFIDGTQGDRYKAVMDLCGIDKIDKIQSAISSSKSTIKKELENITGMHDDKLADLSMMLAGRDDLSFDECVEKVNELLESNQKNTITDDMDFDEFIDNLDLSQLSVISAKINDFHKLHARADIRGLDLKLSNVLKGYESIASSNLKTSRSLLKTLKTSYDYIELTNSDKCPLCENTIDPTEILESITGKINAIDEDNSSFNNWKGQVQTLINEVGLEIENAKNLNSLIDDINKLANDILPNFTYDNLIDFKDDLAEFIEFNKVLSDFNKYSFQPLHNEITAIAKSLIDYEKSQNLDDLTQMYNAIFTIRDLKELDKRIETLSRQYIKVSKTFEVFINSKEQFIRDMISEIRHDIKTYYEYIHGDDLIAAPDIKLTGPKLIDVYLNSFGEMVDSRSYASEGHLDTLGICIFLAFNKKFNEIPFIVFDDVLTTVDLPHKKRIAKLIVEELTDYQFLITTHSPLWADELKVFCNEANRNHIVHEFIDWSLDEGPIIAKQLNAEDKIFKYLSNDHQDLQAAGNTARRYLEYTLKEICIMNKVKVPISDRYDVNSLFEDAKRHTLRVVRGTSVEPYYVHVWGEINKTRNIANKLSHYNPDNLPKNDVVKFCEDVINLNHAFKCKCGKSFLKLDPVSHKMICSNEHCREAVDMNAFENLDLGLGEVEL
ncbi:AAA family ATPase [Methanobrevibacter sp.]